jgi:probable F420-dependent oxidoreductase
VKLDVTVAFDALGDVPALAREAEALGIDGLWTAETRHDPFLPLALAAEHTRRVSLGTAIAVAFPRSPTVVAHTAWDLQAASGGRVILGLGTQVKGHIERRFSVPWTSPGPRLREYILALRAIWAAWQGGGPVNFRGQHYAITLMTPFFAPGPIEHPHIPIYVAAVNAYNLRLAGELCDGVHLHPFHSVRYLREFALPHVQAGLARGGRDRSAVTLAISTFMITGRSADELGRAREFVRAQIAFYASTRTYEPVLAAHGWQDLTPRLHRKSVEGDWAGMAALVTDEMLGAYAVEAPLDELGPALRERYGDLVDRVAPYVPLERRTSPEELRTLASALRRPSAPRPRPPRLSPAARARHRPARPSPWHPPPPPSAARGARVGA